MLARLAPVALATVMLCGAATALQAQNSAPPSDVPVQVGPLALAPRVRLTNAGHDSNVLNQNTDDNPQGDYTATLSPSVETWLRLPHASLNGRSQFDFYWFRELTDLRAV